MTWNSGTVAAPPAPSRLARILLVDDEPAILDGLRRQLRRSFDISTAGSGPEALELLATSGPFAVVLSDMRMPAMDGATLLSLVRERHPDTVRLLLTGQSDMESTIAAINDGQIYRFLTKPCPGSTVETALQDAAELHRQISAERDVLEQTLRGAVQALIDALSLANPQAFSRAVRVSHLVGELARTIDVEPDWELEMSGMLGQVGAVTVPTSVLDKLDAGLLLTAEELAMVDAVPSISERLIAGIPRLGGLAAAIGQQRLRYDGVGSTPADPVGEEIPLAARLLRIAVDMDRLQSQRVPTPAVLQRMSDDTGAYDPRILGQWVASHVEPVAQQTLVTLAIDDIETGMTIAEDVLNARGVVLLGRGSVVTETLLERLRNHAQSGQVSGPLVVARAERR